MSETKTIHIIGDEAWTLSESEKNVLQVAMDHMVEHLEDLVHEHPTAETAMGQSTSLSLHRLTRILPLPIMLN